MPTCKVTNVCDRIISVNSLVINLHEFASGIYAFKMSALYRGIVVILERS